MVEFLKDRRSCDVGITNGAVKAACKDAEHKAFSPVFVDFTFAYMLCNQRMRYDLLTLNGEKVTSAIFAQTYDGSSRYVSTSIKQTA